MLWLGQVEYYWMIDSSLIEKLLIEKMREAESDLDQAMLARGVTLFWKVAENWAVSHEILAEHVCDEEFPELDSSEKSSLVDLVVSVWVDVYTD